MERVVRTASGALWRTTTTFNRRNCRGYAVTQLQMPAMSPTMTEGGIAEWKKRDGESFSAGDVLLEIETDKATIDVEAQEDGIMAKILLPDGSKNVSVGNVIALLAETTDDLSNLVLPDPPSPSPTPNPSPPKTPTPAPHHDRVFPSVHRLLREHAIPDPSVIPATGIRGMLTKGDVLAYLGLASSPSGTFTATPPASPSPSPSSPPPPLDGPSLRRLILSQLKPTSFDSIIVDYKY